MTEVTQLLRRVRDGDRAALEQLMPIVYAELRRIAGAFMRRQPPGHTLQPTALVNEAYLKLFHDAEPQVADRGHLVGLMARAMRQVLVDHARASAAAKRGGGGQKVEWDTNIQVGDETAAEHHQLLDLHRVLEALERNEPALAEVVELHYFAGATAEEASKALGRSVHIVRHQLRLGRAWLRRELSR
jgi:RNA polymerase sigma-70 factor (ECF subfamily)